MADKINLNDAFPSYLSPLFSLDLKEISILSIFLTTAVVIILLVGAYIYLLYLGFKKQLSQKTVLLEIKPPSISLQSSFSTKQLFTILHSLDHKATFIEKLLQVKKRISYEIVSTKEEGIRYLLSIPEEDVSVIRKNLMAYLPGVEIHKVADYLPETFEDINNTEYSINELKLEKSYVLPLQDQDILNKHDPIAYITGQMTKLDLDETISLQLVTTPITSAFHSRITDRLYTLQKRIYDGKEIVSYIQDDTLNSVLKIAKQILFFIFDLVVMLLKDISNWIMDFMMASPHKQYQRVVTFEKHPKGEIRELTPKQKEIQKVVETKIDQQLFEVSLRLFIQSSSQKNILQRKTGIMSSLATFTNPSYQSLKIKSQPSLAKNFFSKLKYLQFKHRLFSLFNNPILSVSELATIYHFPYTETTQTEDLQSIRSIQLPAPITLKKKNNNLDLTFAQNIHGESITPIGLSLEERRRHMYVIGATGMGKTTLLLKMIYQDIQNGKGVAVLDPHGDLADRLLGVIPKSRVKDVIYFNPYDLEYPVGLNVLEMTEGLSETEKEREKDLIASSMVSIFFKLYPSPNARPRMEHILRNTILAALSTENPTLLTAYKLLVDKKYRDTVVAKLEDPLLKDFWEKEFKGFGTYQRAELISPITNKLGRFLTTKTTRNILSQEKNKLQFTEIMNNKKILICDLSKGKIGEDISSFLGSLLIVKLQLAALNRVHIPQEKRIDFFLYIDEFQNFATMTFAQILSEARKYRLDTILAHQTISQIEDKDLLKVILANVGTVISFRTSNPSDEDVILPLFRPQVKENDIANLPSYHFYIKINALSPQNAFTGMANNFTIEDDVEIRQQVITHSQMTYGVKMNDSTKIEKKTNRRSQKEEPTKPAVNEQPVV